MKASRITNGLLISFQNQESPAQNQQAQRVLDPKVRNEVKRSWDMTEKPEQGEQAGEQARGLKKPPPPYLGR